MNHELITGIWYVIYIYTYIDSNIINWLVVLTILKNMKVNGKDYSQYVMAK